MSNSKGLQMTAPFPPNPKATPKRKPVKEQLRKSELRTYALLDNSPNQIFLKDRELRYLYVNPEFERALRFDREHVRGKKVVVIPVLDVDRAKGSAGGSTPTFTSITASGSSSSRRPARGARSNSARTSLRPSPAQPKGCTWSSPTSGLRATTT